MNEFAVISIGPLTSALGEPLVYKPARGPARPIQALVKRLGQRDQVNGPASAWRPRIEITLAQNCTDGIMASEIDRGLDRIACPVRSGSDPVDLSIYDVLSDAHGVLVLDLR